MKRGNHLRILLISASYPPVLGGLQTVAHTLAQHLIAEGHGVRVVTNRYPRTLRRCETFETVPVKRLLFLWPGLDYLRQRRVDLFLASWLYGPATLLRLVRLLRSFRPDVVNVHFPDAQTPYVLWLRRLFDFRLVVSLHGDEVLRWGKGNPATRAGQRPPRTNDERDLCQLQALLRHADAVTACSGWLLGRAVELEPSVAGKEQVIHNSVDQARFQDRTSYIHPRPYIFAYGRLTPKKGFDMLLDAFAHALPHLPNLDLILAGSGEEEGALQRQAEHLGIQDRLYFFGRATAQQVVQLLNGCRFVVIPSGEEPFGIVALEALAAGKPVLATRVGGLPEILSPLAGRGAALVEPTVEAVTQQLRHWIDCLDGLSMWSEENRAHAARFTLERMVEGYLHAFGCEGSS